MSSPLELSPTLRRDWRWLSAAVFLFGFGFATYGAVFLNDITEKLGVTPLMMGGLESMREIPGLLSVGIAAAVASFAETRIGAICLLLSALGVAATGFVHDYAQLVFVTVFWSVFMHQWFTSSAAIPMALAAGQEGGRHLGRMGAIGAGATVAAFALVRLLTGHFYHAVYFYQSLFTLAAVFIFAGGLCLLPMSPHSASVNRQRLLWRREYGLFYGLTFLEGCRRQIFSTFAIFALIGHYHVPLGQIAALMLVNAVATFFVATPIGRLVDRIGERRAMTVYYAAIAFAFLGYAVTTEVGTLKVLYVIDNILFSFGVSLTTYLSRIVRPNEMMPSLSMGQTMNHVAAVAIPVLGGLLWTRFGYHAPFWTGVGAALISLVLTQRVPHLRRVPLSPVPDCPPAPGIAP